MPNVWLAVPPLVVKEPSPKLLAKTNAPSPPTVFFTTRIDPCRVLTMVQVVVAPAATTMAAGVPFEQMALVWVQPEGTVSVRL